MSMTMSRVASLVLLAALVVGGRAAHADDARDADRALAEGRHGDAIAHLEALRTARPNDPVVPYNLGVASWRAGDAEAARRWFGRVLEETADPALRARAAYNLGAMALRNTRPETDAADLRQGLEVLDEAIRHFREALDADPADADARANGELAWRMREVLQQQQQQQQEGDESQDQQEQQQSGEQSQDQQQQSGEQSQDQQQQSGEQSQDQQQSGEPSQNQQQQPGEEPQEQPQSEQEQPGEEPQEQPQEEQPSDHAQPRPDETPERTTRMTRDEAERLLQRVRDRDRQRREAEMGRSASRSRPVEKDW